MEEVLREFLLKKKNEYVDAIHKSGKFTERQAFQAVTTVLEFIELCGKDIK